MLLKGALEYTSRSAFEAGNKKAYNAALKRGIMDEVCIHMKPKRKVWTEDEIKNIALMYTGRRLFELGDRNAYQAALKRGLLDTVCSHMEVTKVTWDFDKLHAEALKYDTRGSFKKNNPSAYAATLRRGLLEDITTHMAKPKGISMFADAYNVTGVYFLYREDVLVYVGKSTGHISTRLWEHMYDPIKVFDKVVIYEIVNKADIALAEVYYITKFAPIYNKDSKSDDALTLSVVGIDEIVDREIIINIREEV